MSRTARTLAFLIRHRISFAAFLLGATLSVCGLHFYEPRFWLIAVIYALTSTVNEHIAVELAVGRIVAADIARAQRNRHLGEFNPHPFDSQVAAERDLPRNPPRTHTGD